MKNKVQLLNKLASLSLLAGGLSLGAAQNAHAIELGGYTNLGTGAEVRSDLLGSTVMCDEEKGGEGKCGEGKCGDKKDDKSGTEAKCGEGKCGGSE